MAQPSRPLPLLIQQELDRLIESDALRRAPSHMRLLRYLVEKRIAGDAAALRETAIALEVFRRDPSTYDPQTDPIVRVTTGRLRERLDAHYAVYNATPRVRIVLPKGRYAPEFVAQATSEQPRLGVAVLRTRNVSGDEALDGCCASLAERLADHLVRAGLPRVVTRAAVHDAEALSTDPAVVGARLHVSWLLESTLGREREDELRLSVRLVHARDGDVRWVETGVGIQADVQRLIDRMLDVALLRTLETLPTPAALHPENHLPSSLPPPRRAALDRARLMVLQRTLSGTDDALALAESVVRAHPDHADTWAALGAALYSRLSFMDMAPLPLLERIRDSVERALAIDAGHPIALRTKAIVLGKCDYDVAGAEQLFERVLRAMPHYTSARLNYAEILALQRKFADALAQLNLARVYDPLSPAVHLARAVCLGYQRAYAEGREAWALCRATGEASVWTLAGAGMMELAAGDLDAARVAVDEAHARFPDMPSVQLARASLQAARGERTQALEIERACVERFPHCSPASLALVAALLGDRDPVLDLVARARAEGDMALLQTLLQPAFDRYADDAELRRLVPLHA